MADLLSSIAALLRADFAVEADAGFPTVKRIPSTEAVKFFDYFAALEPGGRGPLLDAMGRLGAMQFFPPTLVYQEALDLNARNAAMLQLRTALQSGHFAYGLRYVDLRMARAMRNDPESMAHMAQTRSTLDFEPRDDPPKELSPESDIGKIQPAKAPLLRKLMEKAFAQLFSAQKSKLPGGETRYAGSIGSTELTVSVIFSSRFAQLHWFVKMAMANPNLRAFRVEDFWGSRAWDYLTEENASRSIDLLCERIAYLVNLKERIDALSVSPG
jgi:hypothetical protein